jgi:uncharacterized protein (TIGR03437 family)
VLPRLQIATLLLLASGSAFGQTHQPPPGKLSNIFRGPLSTRVAAGDTLAVSITPGGVVPIYSSSTTIQPGSWVSIYGTNLATAVTTWNGDFPTKLAGTTVTINNKPAYLYFIAPNQIDIQAPDDTATGTVPVVVTTPAGTANSTVTLGAFGPSFCVLVAGNNKHYVAGIIVRNDGSGTQGGGTYDFIGPGGNAFTFTTVPVKPGDVLELFGVGFGPTDPAIPAGMVVPPGQFGTIKKENPVTILINGIAVTPSFVGITEAGTFQINLTIPPGVGTGDLTLVALVGGVQTPNGVLITAQ